MGLESLAVLAYHVSDVLAIQEGEERGDWYVQGTFSILLRIHMEPLSEMASVR